MNYQEILKQLETIQHQMDNDGCLPGTWEIECAINELNYYEIKILVK